MDSKEKVLEGKTALVIGVANERSLAWAIARELKEAGARLGFNYLNEALERRVRPLAESVQAEIVEPCDVSKDQGEQGIESFFEKIRKKWDRLDILIHSVAFANKNDLEGRFIDTSREGFRIALDISSYSLIALAKKAEPLMENQGGSIVTLSYYGSQKVVPNYNVMGVAKAALEASVRYLAYDLGPKKIRVNAISAGPVKTLAAAGIRDFRTILSKVEEKSLLRENITADDVGRLAAFLCGPGGCHMTGSTLFLDSGTHVMGF